MSNANDTLCEEYNNNNNNNNYYREKTGPLLSPQRLPCPMRKAQDNMSAGNDTSDTHNVRLSITGTFQGQRRRSSGCPWNIPPQSRQAADSHTTCAECRGDVEERTVPGVWCRGKEMKGTLTGRGHPPSYPAETERNPHRQLARRREPCNMARHRKHSRRERPMEILPSLPGLCSPPPRRHTGPASS